MRNIIFIGQGYMPNGNACALRILSLAQNYIRNGYKCYSINYFSPHQKEDYVAKEFYGVTCFFDKYPISKKEWIKELVDCKREIDIINGIEGEKVILFYGVKAIKLKKLIRFAKSKSIPYIVDIEEYEDYGKSLHLINLVRKIDSSIRMNFIYPRIKNLILISKYLEGKYKKNNNTIVLPTTTNLKPKEELKPNICKNTGKVKLIFAGNIGKDFIKERLDIVMKVLLRNDFLQDISLDIVGVATEDLRTRFTETELEKFNIYGKIDNIKCKEMLAKADFSLIPREFKRKTNAGFPTKLSESFAQGTPVIATDTSDIKDYIVDGKNGYLLSECTEDEFVKVFEKILKLSIEERYDMKQNAFNMNKLVAENFEDDINVFMNNLIK